MLRRFCLLLIISLLKNLWKERRILLLSGRTVAQLLYSFFYYINFRFKQIIHNSSSHHSSFENFQHSSFKFLTTNHSKFLITYSSVNPCITIFSMYTSRNQEHLYSPLFSCRTNQFLNRHKITQDYSTNSSTTKKNACHELHRNVGNSNGK